jgi:hypothetical protein
MLTIIISDNLRNPETVTPSLAPNLPDRILHAILSIHQQIFFLVLTVCVGVVLPLFWV